MICPIEALLPERPVRLTILPNGYVTVDIAPMEFCESKPLDIEFRILSSEVLNFPAEYKGLVKLRRMKLGVSGS